MGASQPRHIFLVGFMAAGKSTVGRLVAERLGLAFVDLDERIEQAHGASIQAIFAERGEDGFRQLEAGALRQVADGPAAVVATGGGTACHGDNLARMRERGLVVALTAPLGVLRARVSDPSTRPLLARPDEDIQSLYEQRIPCYRQAHACVRTEDASPEELARAIERLTRAADVIPDAELGRAHLLALSERSYPIVVSPGSLDRLGELARRVLDTRCTRVGVISDSHVAPLYGERARQALMSAGFEVAQSVVPAGEGAKCFDHLARVSEDMVGAGLDRTSAIIALGGGVVGDLAGLVAATLFRGMDYIQVPTTLVAMVDSAIGGKTGINLAAGKNLVGAFWQPRLVLSDPSVLATLPGRELRAAFGELVKYALLDGEELYAAVDDLAPAVAERDSSSAVAELDSLAEVIRRASAIKSWIVSRDEREQTGERALLNLGHTVGHAIEAAAGYGRLLHGEAVALGLIAACRVSARLRLCPPELEQRVARTLARAGLDVDIAPWLRDQVIGHIGVDKKRTGASIGFITVERVGRCARTAVDMNELSRILR